MTLDLSSEEREALYTVLDAAESWLNEMDEYIIPGEPDLEINASYRDHRADIAAAIDLINRAATTTESEGTNAVE